jgi:CheY-like chemotaxis protein
VILLQTPYLSSQLKSETQKSAITEVLIKPLTPDGLRALIRHTCIWPCRQVSHLPDLIYCDDTRTIEPTRLVGTTILLVEDNEINQDVARSILELEGATVFIVENGAEALECLQTDADHFSLVLMDIQMPVMDGLEATRRIRKELGLARLPVIALTAGALASDRDACLAAGMNDFIPKPFDAEHMVSVIRTNALRS